MSSLICIGHPDTLTPEVEAAVTLLGFEVRRDEFAPKGKVFFMDPDLIIQPPAPDWLLRQ